MSATEHHNRNLKLHLAKKKHHSSNIHKRETEQKGSSAINEKLLDNQDLCLLFQISPRSLQRYRSLGVLPYKRLGQKTYYTEEDVMQFVENNVKEFKKENVEHYLTRIHQKFK